jgi:hypothetical protein
MSRKENRYRAGVGQRRRCGPVPGYWAIGPVLSEAIERLVSVARLDMLMLQCTPGLADKERMSPARLRGAQNRHNLFHGYGPGVIFPVRYNAANCRYAYGDGQITAQAFGNSRVGQCGWE